MVTVPTPAGPAETVVRGSCHHDCPDTCVWDVTVSGGRAVRLRGNRDHPTTQGQLCPKVNRFLERVYHPDRILSPLRRSGSKGSADFAPISWDEALAEVAGRLSATAARSGPSAVLQYSFDGTQGVIQKGLMADRFFDAIGASDVDRHLCGVTAWLGAADISGIPYGIDPEDLRHARTIILWGTNTYLTNRHLWPTIEAARAEGAAVITIDPIRTSTAERSDRFFQVRPGTDVALVLGIIAVLDRDGLLDHGWIAGNTAGWAHLQASAQRRSLPDVAAITGIPESDIEWLAHRYAQHRPAAIRVLVGPEHRRNGRDLMRAIAMLPAVTGAWRDIGGGLARSTQVYFETALGRTGRARPTRRTFNMASLGQVLTDVSLDPPIAALVVHNSNPAVICPDQNGVIAGLERPDLFTVVIEQFMTDTARYADIVLPATTQIEHLDLGFAWGHLYLSLNQPAIEPVGQALPNTEIFRRLARAMDLDDPALHADDESLIREILESDHPWLGGITYDDLRHRTWARLAVPPGFRPNVDRPPDTADGRLALGALEHHSVLDGEYPLALLTRKQHLKFLNANYGGFEAHLPAERTPTLQMHRDDARERGITDGDLVRAFNERGELTLPAVISEEVQPGLVAMPFGWWNHHTPEQRSANALTNPSVPTDRQGSAAFHDTFVQVERQPDP
jgi:anaerobic selenocysteine-containing dehydrogenase